MPNIGSVLKAEITRLARKEAKAHTDQLRKAGAGYRRDIAALKREIAELRRQLAAANRAGKRAQAVGGRGIDGQAVDGDAGTSRRFSAKGLKSHRAKLGLSAADYGRLAGVSGQSIYHWETGKTVPRQAQVASLAALRGLGKREALRRLEEAA